MRRFLNFPALMAGALFVFFAGPALAQTLELQSAPSSCTSRIGTTTKCGDVVYVAVEGDFYLASNEFMNLDGNAAFTQTPGDCTAGRTLPLGSICIVATLYYTPSDAGPHSASISGGHFKARDVSGTALPALTYQWVAGEDWSPTTGCSSEIFQTRTVSCQDSEGQPASEALCDAGAKPADSRSIADYSACTYAWASEDFGSCTGGAGSWLEGDWFPSTGCGAVDQSRSVTCTFTADSGVQTRNVGCQRSDGTTVDDSACDADTRPSGTQSCTPTDLSVCGEPPASNQVTQLDNDCPSDEEPGDGGEGGSGLLRGCTPDPQNNKYCVFFPF